MIPVDSFFCQLMPFQTPAVSLKDLSVNHKVSSGNDPLRERERDNIDTASSDSQCRLAFHFGQCRHHVMEVDLLLVRLVCICIQSSDGNERFSFQTRFVKNKTMGEKRTRRNRKRKKKEQGEKEKKPRGKSDQQTLPCFASL